MKSTELAKRSISLTLMVLLASTIVVADDTREETENEIRFFGKAIFNTHYDTALQPYDFSSYLVDDTEEEFNFNPRDTRLGFVASHKSGNWTYSAVYETDFYGDNKGNSMLPRMRLGYARAENSSGLSITGGQDWIPIAQQNPGCIDFGIMSWSGNLWSRVPQMTLRSSTANMEYLFGVMKHRISNSQEMQEVMPWIMGRLAVNNVLSDGSLLALGGGWRNVTYEGRDYSPFVVACEFTAPIAGRGIQFNGEFYYSDGAGREFVHYGFDYNPTHPGHYTTIGCFGGFINLRVPLGVHDALDVGWGIDDPDNEDLLGKEEVAYLVNRSVYISYRKSITKHFGFGMEGISYITEQASGVEITGERFSTSWWYKF